MDMIVNTQIVDTRTQNGRAQTSRRGVMIGGFLALLLEQRGDRGLMVSGFMVSAKQRRKTSTGLDGRNEIMIERCLALHFERRARIIVSVQWRGPVTRHRQVCNHRCLAIHLERRRAGIIMSAQ